MNRVRYGIPSLALIGVAAFSLTACFRDAKVDAPVECSLDGSRESMVECLASYAGPKIVTLGRDVYTYHYGAGTDHYMNPDDDGHRRGVNGSIGDSFHNRNKRHPVKDFNTWLGDGYYTATDPAFTRQYASPEFMTTWQEDYTHPWAVGRVIVPSGSMLLDIGVANPLAPEVVEALKDFDCDITMEMYKANRSATAYERTNSNPDLYDLFVVTSEQRHGCRQLVTDLVERLQITAVIYHFGSFLPSSSALKRVCSAAAHRAFLFTNALPSGTVRLFTRGLPDSDDGAMEERLMIQGIYRAISNRPLLWPSLAGREPSESEVLSFVSEHLLGCGDHSKDVAGPAINH